jgi:hypothetical protein
MESGRSPGSAVGWRATQLAGVQVIYLLRLVILARLLAPEAFGLLAIATVAISVLMRLSDLGMIQALVQRPEPSELEYDVAWTAGLIRASAVAAAIAVLAPTAARLFAEPGAAPIMQVLVLRPVIDAARSIGTARLTRELRFRELAFMHVPAALTDACIAVALAGTLGVWALVVGALTGAIVQTALSYVLAPHRPRLRFQAHAAEPLVRYGRWVLLTGIIALAASSVQQLLLSRHLGAGALGVYYLAAKLAFLPVETTSTVLGSVAFPLYAAQREDDRATATAFGTLFAGQAILLFPLYAMLVVLAPSFEAALGTRWIVRRIAQPPAHGPGPPGPCPRPRAPPVRRAPALRLAASARIRRCGRCAGVAAREYRDASPRRLVLAQYGPWPDRWHGAMARLRNRGGAHFGRGCAPGRQRTGRIPGGRDRRHCRLARSKRRPVASRSTVRTAAGRTPAMVTRLGTAGASSSRFSMTMMNGGS